MNHRIKVYNDQYITNKNMYINIKTHFTNLQSGGKRKKRRKKHNNNFYFTHMANQVDNALSILKDGYIKLSQDVEVKRKMMGGTDPLPYLYTNIQFDDLNNLMEIGGIILLLHPKLAYEYDLIFNKYWSKYPTDISIIINKSDTLKNKKLKIKEIKEYIKNPTFYENTPFGDRFDDLSKLGIMSHEVLFDKQIPLDEYLLGVICSGCSDEIIKQIKKLIKQYPNAKILKHKKDKDGELRLPTLNNILN